jgi:hypothetical protein
MALGNAALYHPEAMPDPDDTAACLTGRWTGYYLQRDRRFPITAELLQDGHSLSGSMRDESPESDWSLFEVASHEGLPPGADEQIESSLRKMHPYEPARPIRYVFRLPPASDLKGRCRGHTVSFLKTYQGRSFSGYKVGDKHVGVEREDHEVHYEGRLSPDGMVIEGRWWIDAKPPVASRTEGLFMLYRADPNASAQQTAITARPAAGPAVAPHSASDSAIGDLRVDPEPGGLKPAWLHQFLEMVFFSVAWFAFIQKEPFVGALALFTGGTMLLISLVAKIARASASNAEVPHLLMVGCSHLLYRLFWCALAAIAACGLLFMFWAR